MIVQDRQRTSDAVPAPADSRLTVGSVSMTFGNAHVLQDVSFDIAPGEIQALIGQNGSGKSTVAKILTGLYTPDPGSQVSVDGQRIDLPIHPDAARARGVAVVHQSLGLVQDATVLENARLGRLAGSRFLRRIDWRREAEEIRVVFERMGRQVPLDARVADLREDERAVVAIARALQDLPAGGGLIILDESTRALGRDALEGFFGLLDDVVAGGTSVLLITHRLEEVVEAADRVTVLRDGKVVVAGQGVEGLDTGGLAELMLGRNLGDLERRTPSTTIPDGSPVQVDSVTGLGVHDLGFTVQPGEVVGLTGLGGSGYDDVTYVLSGVSPAKQGSIVLDGRSVDVRRLNPAAAIESGIALVPEGRETAGLALEMTMIENLGFPQSCSGSGAIGGMLRPLRHSYEKQLAERWIRRLDVRPRQPAALLKHLSGGNQQKVLLAKWLATEPNLLLLHEPTQAVDVGARHIIVDSVRQAAHEGVAIIVASSDENELALLCDRILVFREGAVGEELTGELTPERIVGAIYAGGERTRLRKRADTPPETVTDPFPTRLTKES